MTELEIKAYAKVNLTLDVLKKREDNYHDISSIMQQISLHDTITIKSNPKVIVQCKGVPEENNLAYKAAYLLKNTFNVKAGAFIDIEKKIPIGGGLSGGSSDAASVLKALNELWELHLNIGDLERMGAELGMDVPFSILGGTCIATNRGEIVEKIKTPELHFVLVNPGIGISTKEAYSVLNLDKCGRTNSTQKMLKAIKENDIKGITDNLHNDFEYSLSERYSFIKDIKEDLKKNGAISSVMSGSGATIYGVFENKDKAKISFQNLKKTYEFVSIAESIK
jgi:4-diphosphocytidyl-2-C-methyl-D-erythritol kinase